MNTNSCQIILIMKIHAYKYQGAGNDFVILDNRSGKYRLTTKQINLLCDRRFGIGADGLMLLGKSKKYDFSMRYFNADGKEGTMCGNGGRCLSAFAAQVGVIGKMLGKDKTDKGIQTFEFEAIDGYHKSQILKNAFAQNHKSSAGNKAEKTAKECIVKLKMKDVDECKKYSPTAYFLNTCSAHYVEFVKDVKNYPVAEKGKYWRWHKDFKGGTNANFVSGTENGLFVRTYERGVEAETYACGTGITASCIAAYTDGCQRYAYCKKTSAGNSVKFNAQALGGKLSVEFLEKDGKFTEVYLTGPATFVFECEVEI